MEKGYEFRYGNSHAEFVLHALEEWGRELLRELNGVFVFVVYDAVKHSLTFVNDRHGMKPLYYHYDKPFLIFASEVKAIIRDGKVGREIDWDGWHDVFSYGYVMGTKTVFKNISSLYNAAVVTLDRGGISFDKYWRYDEVKVVKGLSERDWVDEGARLFRQAIERQTRNLKECVVPLSAGYDSRGIACAIKKYTDVEFDTFTLFTCCEDVFFAREIAEHLNVDNIYIKRPRDLIERHLVDMVYLEDGMRIYIIPPPVTMMMLHFAREGPEVSSVIFTGLAGPIFRGRRYEREEFRDAADDEKLARLLDRQLRHPDITEFFRSPIREKLKPRIDSLIEEIESIKKHENEMQIWTLRNVEKNKMGPRENNITSIKTNCYFPYLDNDLVQYSLSMPLKIKKSKGVLPKIIRILFGHKTNYAFHHKTMKKTFPNIMKISSTTSPVFSRFYLSTLARSKKQKKELFTLLLKHLKNTLFHRRPYSQTEEARHLTRQELGYMLDLLKSLKIPPFIHRERLTKKIKTHLKNNKDPSHILIPLLEFCIWYNLFINDIPPSKLITNIQTHIREDPMAD